MFGSFYSAMRNVWGQITQPADSVKYTSLRQLEGLSGALLLALLLATLIFAPIWVLADSEYPEAPYLAAGLILALGVAYALSRTKYAVIGQWIGVLSLPIFAVAIFFTTTGPPAERLLGLNLLIISNLLVVIFFGRRATMVFAFISVVAIALFALVPGVSLVLPFSYIVPMVGMAALLVVISTIVENASQHLHESEERYFNLFKQSNDAVFILDLEGRHRKINQRAAEMFGYSHDELIALGYRDLVAPADLPRSQDILQRILAGEQIPPYERVFLRKDGSELLAEVNVEAVRNLHGQPTHIQSIVRDISERKQAEQALLERDKYLMAVMNNAPSGMHFYQLLPDGKLVLDAANPAADKILGIAHQALIGLPIEEAFPGLVGTDIPNSYKRIADDGTSLHERVISYEDPRVQGIFEILAFQTMPNRMAVFFVDVTERKHAEEQSLALAVEKERMNILKQFVENTAHELRTPLAIINTKTFLVERAANNDACLRYTDNIRQQTARLTKLLEMMNHMVILDSGVSLAFQSADIDELLSQVIERTRTAMTEKSLSVNVELDSLNNQACVDVTWLEEAIQNLVDNAVRFTPVQGSITARQFSLDGDVVIEIGDTGSGISQEAMPHIFERFWRQDDAHSTPGFGLGLSIAQRIVEQHDGKIEVESSEGEGSTFRVILPRGEDRCKQPLRVFN